MDEQLTQWLDGVFGGAEPYVPVAHDLGLISRADSDLDDEAEDSPVEDPPDDELLAGVGPPHNVGAQSAIPPAEDPFYYPPSTSVENAIPTPAQVHPNPVVYYIYLLVFWLHSQCNLPFRACKAILVTFTVILNVCGVGPLDLKTTLPGVMHALNAEPTFRVCPVCPKCQKVFSPATESTEQCCNEPLFHTKPTAANQRQGRDERQIPKPRMQFPYKLLEEQLATMLAVPGIENEIEQSRVKLRSTTPGEYNNIFDGRVCHTLPCKDGSLFFDPSDEVCNSGELRIGLALGIDW